MRPVHAREHAGRAAALGLLLVVASLALPAPGHALGGASSTAIEEAARKQVEESHKASGPKITVGLPGKARKGGGVSRKAGSATPPETSPTLGLSSGTGSAARALSPKAPASRSKAPTSSATSPGGRVNAPTPPGRNPTTTLPRTSTLSAAPTGRVNPTSPRPHAGSGHVSTLAIVIGALGALLLLACAGWALARRRAFEPHWWLSMRHSLAEAGHRASGTWAEFTDWARLGR
jgi:hypothetical protein